MSGSDEYQKLLEHPAIALHPSFRFASLFELVLTKLLHEIH
jgi:hypothetical protein